MSRPNLLILGASARAAAFSARRAGFQPLAVDLFGDLDLAACCLWSRRAEPYPQALPATAREAPDAPWLYTGALENWPRMIERFRRARALLGNSGPIVAAVRDPLRLADTLRAAGLLFPATYPGDALPERLDHADSWLAKSYASSGGNGIYVYQRPGVAGARRSESGQHEGPRNSDSPAAQANTMRHAYRPSFFVQRQVAGNPFSATFVGAGGQARLVGLTRQLVGTPWAGASGFQYAGSIGPLAASPAIQATLQRLGNRLSDTFGLVGLFGVDLVIDPPDVWTIEVNPRYTASVEILERGGDLAAIAWHVAACRGTLPNDEDERRSTDGLCHGKVILYAQRDQRVSEPFVAAALRANEDADEHSPVIADIPRSGTRLTPGQPICTLFAAGSQEDQVEHALRDQVARWRATLEAA